MKKTDESFLDMIEDEYKRFLVKDESRDVVDVIPTGSLALDFSIGVGGIPRGKFTTVYGPEGSGKTTLALSIARQAHNRGLKVLYIDPENGLDYQYVDALVGTIDSSSLVIMQPEYAEDAFEIAEAGISSGEFGLIIFDSIGALVPKKVKEGEFGDAHVALVARMLGQFLARNSYQVRTNNVAFLFINQVRAKIGAYMGGYEMPGGYALKHDCSLVIFMSKGEEIKQPKGDPIGILTRFTVKKNKLAPPFRTNFIPIIFGSGVDSFRDIVMFSTLLGVIEQRGAYYKLGDVMLGQGMDKTIEYLKGDKETLDRIVEMCYTKNQKKVEVLLDKEEINE